jgi:hypothetical protein
MMNRVLPHVMTKHAVANTPPLVKRRNRNCSSWNLSLIHQIAETYYYKISISR